MPAQTPCHNLLESDLLSRGLDDGLKEADLLMISEVTKREVGELPKELQLMILPEMPIVEEKEESVNKSDENDSNTDAYSD